MNNGQRDTPNGFLGLNGSGVITNTAFLGTGINATQLAGGSTTNTDFNNLAGTTGNLQTQINAILMEGVTFEAIAIATANITIATPGSTDWDGVTPSIGDSVFLLPVASGGSQTAAAQGGLYTYNGALVPLTRYTGMSTWAEVVGSRVFIDAGGTSFGSTAWLNTNNLGGTIGVTTISYQQMQNTYAAGTNLQLTGNIFSIISNPAFTGGATITGGTFTVTDGVNASLIVNSSTNSVTTRHNTLDDNIGNMSALVSLTTPLILTNFISGISGTLSINPVSGQLLSLAHTLAVSSVRIGAACTTATVDVGTSTTSTSFSVRNISNGIFFLAVNGTVTTANNSVDDGVGNAEFVGNLIANLGIQAGTNGNAASLISMPPTLNRGSLNIACVDNSGNNIVIISNASHGQSTTYSIPDVGAATGQILNKTAAFVSGNVIAASGTAGKTVDGGVAANTILTSAITTPDVGSNLIALNITIGQAALASGGSVTIQASSGSKQYKILSLQLNSGGTNFSGGGGNRLGQVTDGTTVYTVIPAANMQALTNAQWGSTALPNPASAAINTSTVAGANLVFKYSGGTTDYTAGSLTLTALLQRVA